MRTVLATSSVALPLTWTCTVMPKPKLWTILHSAEDKCLYIKSGEDVRSDYGALLDVRCSKERDDVVKVRLDYVVQ